MVGLFRCFAFGFFGRFFGSASAAALSIFVKNVEEEEGSGYDADDGPLAELKWQSFVIVYFIAVCICIDVEKRRICVDIVLVLDNYLFSGNFIGVFFGRASEGRCIW